MTCMWRVSTGVKCESHPTLRAEYSPL
ncbi:hypothetical protein ANCDUO_20137 [Ancylostoma duodenale]|uniref:Uncharacterized protein n=1 Tax=Ancylostoma duodenale TaxID=51022 RepID=A0A0C2FY59_9BILA|nr:hypothetical protein ANCDUO_20137 [Ancylostoma duodenale]